LSLFELGRVALAAVPAARPSDVTLTYKSDCLKALVLETSVTIATRVDPSEIARRAGHTGRSRSPTSGTGIFSLRLTVARRQSSRHFAPMGFHPSRATSSGGPSQLRPTHLDSSGRMARTGAGFVAEGVHALRDEESCQGEHHEEQDDLDRERSPSTPPRRRLDVR
jgi:hypothetical protein